MTPRLTRRRKRCVPLCPTHPPTHVPPHQLLPRRYLSTGVFDAAAGKDDPLPVPAPEFHSALARLLYGHQGPHFVLFTGPGGAASAGALAGARAVVEAGKGRLLEVHAADDLQLHNLRMSIA